MGEERHNIQMSWREGQVGSVKSSKDHADLLPRRFRSRGSATAKQKLLCTEAREIESKSWSRQGQLGERKGSSNTTGSQGPVFLVSQVKQE